MIRVILLGRTGNNLFQYALGRVLAEKHDVPLVLDGSWYNAEGWAEVSHFLKLPIRAEVVRPCTLGARALRKFTGKHYWEYGCVPVLKEPTDDQSFNPGYLDAPADCVLFGYFQSPLYFKDIACELRTELNELISRETHSSRVPGSTPGLSSLASGLSEPDSVAVHVRRGDYLHLPAFKVCDTAYYLESMCQMRDRLSAARFFIFSDDPEWCRNQFREPDLEVIDSGPAGKNPLHDLHLMSQANHHIIANSSYSWWAAWLGDKPDQHVIMPDKWYVHGIKAPIVEKKWKM